MTKKILSISEFEELDSEAKIDLLHKEGAYVGKRKHEGLDMVLFQLYDFYVEIHYKKYRSEIDHLVISCDTSLLQPYLDQVRVNDLDKDKTDQAPMN